MESIKTSVSSILFLENFLELKKKMTFPLPSDLILYQCENCNINLSFNNNGVIEIPRALDKHVGCMIDDMLKCFIENHANENYKCSSMICIHPFGAPNNIIVSFPESDQVHIKQFKIGIDSYQVKLVITTENNKSIFALYQKENFLENEYSEFVECNFNTFLNVRVNDKDKIFEEIIVDDESLNDNQHFLPRMTGGGRALNAEFNYECEWCEEDVINTGKKGRFRELKSYRKHFKAHHHSEEGNGVSMAEFNERVKRSEPTWFCEKCQKPLSLGNAVRHKAICDPELSSSESNDGEAKDSRINHQNTRKQKETNISKETQNVKRHKVIFYPETRNSESDDEGKSDRVDKSNNNTQKERPKLRKKKKCVYDFPSSSEEEAETSKHQEAEIDETETMQRQRKENENLYVDNIKILDKEKGKKKLPFQEIAHSKRNITNECVSSSDEQQHQSSSKINNKKKIKTLNVDYTFLDLDDEFYCSSNEDDVTNTLIEPKLEPENDYEIEIEIQSSLSNPLRFNQWWQKRPPHLYGDRGLGGPKIFLPNDKEDFVKRCTEKYNNHMQEKELLDRKMQEAESEDAKLLQFSETRDKPILKKYSEFVQNYSAKDVLHIFSDEYEQLNLPIGSKSSTATQYSYRIVEFFKFMASSYNNFHLDWMMDFKGKIEKTYKEGSKSKDIFLPTKKDLTEFIKKFKYGSNPAANCGLRIFAIKKLLDFLKQEIKDHEHIFEGSIVEKANIVDSLLKTIDNLNETVVPAGMIKVMN